MFDIAWSELAVIAVVTLVAVGPKDLPKVVYEAGKWVRRARSLSREFQGAFDQMMREAELEEIRKKAEDAARAASSGKLLSDTLDPDHVIGAAFNPTLLGSATTPLMPDAGPPPAPNLAPPGATAPEAGAEDGAIAEELEDFSSAPGGHDHAGTDDDFDDLPMNVVVPPKPVATVAEAGAEAADKASGSDAGTGDAAGGGGSGGPVAEAGQAPGPAPEAGAVAPAEGSGEAVTPVVEAAARVGSGGGE